MTDGLFGAEIGNSLVVIRHSDKKNMYWVLYLVTLRPEPKARINLGLDLEFNSIHFGKGINKCKKHTNF